MATTSRVPALRLVRSSDAPGNVSELVIRALNVAYYEWLPARDELYVSPALLEMFGYESGPGPWQLDWDALHPDDQMAHSAAWTAYLEGDADGAEFVYRASTASGEYRWWRNQSTAERDATGQVTRVVGAVSDISEEKQRAADLAVTQQALDACTTALAQHSERIEQQSTMIDVLKAMLTSPGDARPVFDLIAERALAFCQADGLAVALLQDSMLHLLTHRGLSEMAGIALETAYPRPLSTGPSFGRAMLVRDVVLIPDAQADLEYGLDAFTEAVSGAMLSVPLMRDGKPIGAITLGRKKPGDYSPTQVAYVRTFAEQAVIAVGNADAYRELQARSAARGTEL